MAKDEAAAFIRAFVESWGGGFDAIVQALQQNLTEDCVWKNSGLPDVVGPEQAIALERAAFDEAGVDAIKSEIVSMAVDYPYVAVERLDHLLRVDGSLIATMPVMGMFRLAGGKIAAWSDYTDPTPLAKLMPSHG